MEITEVRIKLMDEAGDRLKAFCSITLDDCFVVRDLKIIEGTNGPFVAMPSRKLSSRCPKCGYKNHLKAAYCNDCGQRQESGRMVQDENGRAKLYADIAHPINSDCREMMQTQVIAAFQQELERSKQPGYVSSYEEFDVEEQFDYRHDQAEREPRRSPHRTVKPPSANGSRETSNEKKAKPAPKQQSSPDSDQGDFGAGIF